MAEKPGLLRRAWNVLLKRGPLSVGKTVMARVAHFIYEHHEGYILERDLHEPIEQYEAKTPCECKFLENEEEIDQLIAMQPNRTREVINERLAAGKRCNIVRVGDKIVYVGWGDTGDVYLPNPSGRVFSKKKVVTFPEGYIYREGSYTPPEERRKGYMNASFSFAFKALRDMGYRTAICTVACKNEPMLKGAAKYGYRRTKKVKYVKVLGVKSRKVEDLTSVN
jgi:hypothetical protein